MTEKLMPCPFCGGPATLWTPTMRRESGMQPNAREPSCDQCGASMGFFVGKAEAITAWNTRPLESQGTPTPAADEVEALDLLFQIDNLDPAEIVKSPSFVKETVREAIAALQAKANG